MTRKHVVVIGAGFSGVAAAAALARQKNAPRVTLIERGAFGQGLAYGAKDPSHLLNVRASNMSAYADKPADFRPATHRIYHGGAQASFVELPLAPATP